MSRRIRADLKSVIVISEPILAVLTAGEIVPDGAQVDEALLEPDNTILPEYGNAVLSNDGEAGEPEEPATTDHEPATEAGVSVEEQPVKQAVKQTRARTKA